MPDDEFDRDDALLEGNYEVFEQTTYGDTRPECPGDVVCRFCREEFDTITGEKTHRCPERNKLEFWDSPAESPLVRPETHELGAECSFKP